MEATTIGSLQMEIFNNNDNKEDLLSALSPKMGDSKRFTITDNRYEGEKWIIEL